MALLNRRDIVHTIALDGDLGREPTLFARCERKARAVLHDEHAIGQRLVGLDLDVGPGSLHRAKIAALFVSDGLHARPGRVMIGDPQLLHSGQIDDGELELF